MPARQPLEMPGRYGFHSTRPAPWEASQCGVERRPPVQSKGAVNFRRSGSLRNTASALVATSSAALSSRCDQCDYCRSLLPDEPRESTSNFERMRRCFHLARSRPPACPQAPCPVRRAEGRGRRTGHPTASRSATLRSGDPQVRRSGRHQEVRTCSGPEAEGDAAGARPAAEGRSEVIE